MFMLYICLSSNLSNYEIDKKKLDLHTNNMICLNTVEKYIH